MTFYASPPYEIILSLTFVFFMSFFLTIRESSLVAQQDSLPLALVGGLLSHNQRPQPNEINIYEQHCATWLGMSVQFFIVVYFLLGYMGHGQA